MLLVNSGIAIIWPKSAGTGGREEVKTWIKVIFQEVTFFQNCYLSLYNLTLWSSALIYHYSYSKNQNDHILVSWTWQCRSSIKVRLQKSRGAWLTAMTPKYGLRLQACSAVHSLSVWRVYWAHSPFCFPAAFNLKYKERSNDIKPKPQSECRKESCVFVSCCQVLFLIPTSSSFWQATWVGCS